MPTESYMSATPSVTLNMTASPRLPVLQVLEADAQAEAAILAAHQAAAEGQPPAKRRLIDNDVTLAPTALVL